MSKVTLEQILQYLQSEDESLLIQVVTSGHDWDDAYEVTADCDLLKPFYDYIVTDLRGDLSYMDGEPIIKVGIEKNNVVRLDERKVS